MKLLKFTLFSLMLFVGFAAKAQLPIAYYDFEDNAARNTTVETTVETAVSTIGAPALTPYGTLTAAHGAGNGTAYPTGSIDGMAIGYFGFSNVGTQPTAAASNTAPHLDFGPYDFTGLSTVTLTMDVIGIGDRSSRNLAVYWSTNGVTYTAITNRAVTGTYSNVSYTLPAGVNNQTTVYIRVLGYNPLDNVTTPDAANGVVKIDNFTLSATTFTGALTLANAVVHGEGLSSGGTYVPDYGVATINSGVGNDVTMSSALTFNGILTLTSGNLVVGSNTLSLNYNGTPIARTSGFISMSTTSNLEIGDGTQTVTTTIPNTTFVTPTNFNSLTINRLSGTTNWSNNPITVSGDLVVTSGTTGTFVVNNAAGTISVGGNTAINNNGRLTVSAANSFSVTGNVDVNNSGIFTVSATSANASIAGNLNINNSAQVVASGTNTGANVTILVGGNFNIGNSLSLNGAASIVSVGGNVTGSGTINSFANTRRIIMTGSGKTLSSTITYGNVEINSAGSVSLTGSTTFNGVITLTSGNLVVGSNTLSLNYNGTPIARTSGFISMSATSNLVIGDGTQTATVTIPNSIFVTPTNFNSLTTNRASGTVNWGNNPITLSGNANIDAGSGGYFILNNVTGTMAVGGNLNINSGEFRVSVGSNNTVTGNLNIVGTLGLTAATAYITVSGSVTGTGAQTLASTGRIIMVGAGANTLASTVTYDNVEINTASGVSLTGATTFIGNLMLTNGNLNVGSNKLTFHTDNTPISRTGGYINLSTTSSLAFGSAGNLGGNNFVIPNDVFNSASSTVELESFTLNKTNRITLNNQNFYLRKYLSIDAGTLALPNNYLFTLRSTSITNTAMVTAIGATGAITYGTNAAFRVERYIPQTGGTGIRGYRDLSPGVLSTGTLFSNWQEGGVDVVEGGVHYGTHITGKAGGWVGGVDATTGYDKTYSGAGSLSTFDIDLGTGNGAWTTWSTTTSKTTNQVGDVLSPFKGYRILIRGDRAVDLFQNPTPTGMNAPATLRAKGTLVTGDVAYKTTGVTANGNTNTNIRLNSGSATGFTIVGNPYACSVDWSKVLLDAVNVQSTYWIYDPNVAGYATYNSGTTVPPTSAANKYIQPGQAFFIRNNSSTTPQLTFKESHKAPYDGGNLTLVYKSNDNLPAISRIYININKSNGGSGYNLVDGTAIVFRADFNDGNGPEDAGKITNPNENISIISKNNNQWAIEGRSQVLPTTDTVQLRVFYAAQVPVGGNYQLEIDASGFIPSNNTQELYLLDKLNNTETLLNKTGVSTYNFTITSAANTYNLRFALVFKANNALPVTFISTTAAQQENAVRVNWSVAENNIATYEVEKGSNANELTKVIALNAKGTNMASTQDYAWVDNQPFSNNNYYRIKAIGKDGKTTYSNIVMVKMNSKISSITVYPNPIKDRRMSITTENLAKGDYDIQIVGLDGKLVHTSSIKHLGGTATYTVNLTNTVASGMYQLVIKGKDYNETQRIIVE